MSNPLLETIASPAHLKKLEVGQLPQVAQELRAAICDQIARTGGHFASNLGVIELTIALHYVFDFSRDRLLFDVGHQCYPHKLLTGRQDLFARLKQRDGMAGFPDPRESPYDLFAVGHAGTSISTAVGMARADSMLGQDDRRAVALVGDASIVNGVAMEGLNDAGTLQRQFLVVLNDNGMAIAPPQGALSHYLARVRVSPTYGDLKKRAHEVLKHVPGGSHIETLYHRAGEMMKAAIVDGHMFEHFGLLCLGPVDGHNLPDLISMLKEVKDFDRPVLLHCKTIKGKGYELAEKDAFKYHAPKTLPKSMVVTGCKVEKKSSGTAFTKAFADSMIDMMERDDKIIAVTAAMPDGTGLDKIMPKFPDRTFDAGLCESHAMDMCAGMARAGLKPFFAVYSSFSQRALDQVFQEIALHHLPVRICMDRAGYVGGDGAVMHGFMDVSMYRVFPKAVVLAASDEPNMRAALEFMRSYEAGPSFIRYPRDKVAEQPVQTMDETPPYQMGKANLIHPHRGPRAPRVPGGVKPDLAIVAYGSQVYLALAAVEQLEQQGYDVALYDARFAKPIDIDLIEQLIDQGIGILTVEDHTLVGGFGAAVLEACNDRRISTDLIHRLGMPEHWLYHDSRNGQLEMAGLDAAGIARRVRAVLSDTDTSKLDIHIDVKNVKFAAPK